MTSVFGADDARQRLQTMMTNFGTDGLSYAQELMWHFVNVMVYFCTAFKSALASVLNLSFFLYLLFYLLSQEQNLLEQFSAGMLGETTVADVHRILEGVLFYPTFLAP